MDQIANFGGEYFVIKHCGQVGTTFGLVGGEQGHKQLQTIDVSKSVVNLRLEHPRVIERLAF